jgi:ribulose 1,5-bisphosphate carboxylase large subunit-like protein
MGGGDDMSGGDSSGENNEEEADKEDTKLSDKANNILNQQLYNRMKDRNSEIEEVLGNLKELVPLLPYDVVKSNDELVNQLKDALEKGQKYVINDFVDSGYGENQLFYQKLDSLYVLLLNRIDTNLKKIKNKQ